MRKLYPVSKEMCEKCGSCHLVTKTITDIEIPESDQYYQCTSDVNDICAEAYKEEEPKVFYKLDIQDLNYVIDTQCTLEEQEYLNNIPREDILEVLSNKLEMDWVDSIHAVIVNRVLNRY